LISNIFSSNNSLILLSILNSIRLSLWVSLPIINCFSLTNKILASGKAFFDFDNKLISSLFNLNVEFHSDNVSHLLKNSLPSFCIISLSAKVKIGLILLLPKNLIFLSSISILNFSSLSSNKLIKFNNKALLKIAISSFKSIIFFLVFIDVIKLRQDEINSTFIKLLSYFQIDDSFIPFK
jgi:hypothetical protein